MKAIGILLSGGTGKRFGSPIPKQFLKLGGKMVLEYSFETFYRSSEISEIIVVTPKEFALKTEKILKKLRNELHNERKKKKEPSPQKNFTIVLGGETRHQSFLNAAKSIPDLDPKDILVVHDVARPFVSQYDISDLLLATHKTGLASLYSKVKDTILEKSNFSWKFVERENLYSLKTPQSIRAKEFWICEKNANSPKKDFPDLCSFGLENKLSPEMVLSNPFNEKLTFAEDRKFLESLLTRIERSKKKKK